MRWTTLEWSADIQELALCLWTKLCSASIVWKILSAMVGTPWLSLRKASVPFMETQHDWGTAPWNSSIPNIFSPLSFLFWNESVEWMQPCMEMFYRFCWTVKFSCECHVMSVRPLDDECWWLIVWKAIDHETRDLMQNLQLWWRISLGYTLNNQTCLVWVRPACWSRDCCLLYHSLCFSRTCLYIPTSDYLLPHVLIAGSLLGLKTC